MRHKIIKSLLLLVLLVAVGACKKDTNTAAILNPDAGTDFLDIENEGYKATLQAIPAPEGQVGVWRIYMGENGRFDDVNDPKSNFYGEPGEKYVLGWEISQSGEYEAASINVTFKPLNPIILSSHQDTIHNNISMYLNAEAPRFGASGKWSIIYGKDASIINAEKNEAEFIGAKFKEYTLRWTLTYGSKVEFKDIKFLTDELKAYAGEDNLDIETSKAVEEKFFTLEGFLPAGATGKWDILKGQLGTVHSKTVDNSLFEGVADTTYTLSWTVNLNGIESVDTVNVRFRGKWGVWTDYRDGQSYRYTKVGKLDWMADNYNYVAEPGVGSWYYGQAERSIIANGYALETEEDRKKYGRLYDYYAARDSAPEGWRLPTADEFKQLVVDLGGPLYARDQLMVGGSTGIDLNLSGYFEKSSTGDPAFRNVFDGQDKFGMFWLNDYFESAQYASVYDISYSYNEPGVYALRAAFYGLSVRYVRDVENN